MKSNTSSFTSSMSVAQIGNLLNQAYSRMGATVDPIQASSNPLDSFSTNPDISVVASGKGLVRGKWAVQTYVTDAGSTRRIALIALGDSGGMRAFNGTKNTLSLGKSSEVLAEIIQMMKSSDPSLQEV